MAENKEKFCSDCKHDDKMASEYPCNECCNAYTSKFEAKTNFDRIKEMSVGEMAHFINRNYKCRKCAKHNNRCDCNCVEGIIQWLESEVESNG